MPWLSTAVKQRTPVYLFSEVFGLIGLNWTLTLLHVYWLGLLRWLLSSGNSARAGESEMGTHSPGPNPRGSHPSAVSPRLPYSLAARPGEGETARPLMVLEIKELYFCYILLVKASHKTSPDSKREEIGLMCPGTGEIGRDHIWRLSPCCITLSISVFSRLCYLYFGISKSPMKIIPSSHYQDNLSPENSGY